MVIVVIMMVIGQWNDGCRCNTQGDEAHESLQQKNTEQYYYHSIFFYTAQIFHKLFFSPENLFQVVLYRTYFGEHGCWCWFCCVVQDKVQK